MSYNKDWMFEQVEKNTEKKWKKPFKKWQKMNHKLLREQTARFIRLWYEKKLSDNPRFQG